MGELSFGEKHGLMAALHDKDDVISSINERLTGIAIRSQMPVLDTIYNQKYFQMLLGFIGMDQKIKAGNKLFGVRNDSAPLSNDRWRVMRSKNASSLQLENCQSTGEIYFRDLWKLGTRAESSILSMTCGRGS